MTDETFAGLKDQVLKYYDETPNGQYGLNEQQARSLFGSDFTGLQLVDGQYRPDSSAVSRLRGDSGSSSAVTSSSDYRASLEDDLTSSISEIDTLRARLEERKQSAINDINSQLDEQKKDTEFAQKGQMGAKSLFYAGTQSIGRTASGQSNLEQLATSQRQELDALEQKRLRLINDAQVAYEEKDFNLLKFKIQEIRTSRKEADDLALSIENNRIKQAQEARADAEFNMKVEDHARTVMKDTASALASGLVGEDLSVPSYEEIGTLSDQYGIDPTLLLRAVNDRQDAVRKITTEGFKDYFNIAKQLDEGTEIQAPDGTVIKGLKQNKPDIITYEANVGGMKFKVGADKSTGEVLWQNPVGAGGSSSGGGKTVTWAMAKDLGDLSLYGQPVAEIYKKPEAMTFDDWILMKNTEDPNNYPLYSPDPGSQAGSDIWNEYLDYMEGLTSTAEDYQLEQERKQDEDDSELSNTEKELWAVQAVDEYRDKTTAEELIALIMEQTSLTYSKAKTIVNDNYKK